MLLRHSSDDRLLLTTLGSVPTVVVGIAAVAPVTGDVLTPGVSFRIRWQLTGGASCELLVVV